MLKKWQHFDNNKLDFHRMHNFYSVVKNICFSQGVCTLIP